MSLTEFNICSFNCKGFKYRNYNYISKLFEKSDVLLLQEHWLYNFEFNEFNRILKRCKYVSKSSMNECCINEGRPFGGVAILFKDVNGFFFEEIPTISDRIVAVRFQFGSFRCVFASIYMPCNVASNNDEFFEILTELSMLSSIYDDINLIIGGDFNVNYQIHSTRSEIFKNFKSNIELFCPNADGENKYSYSFMNSAGDRSMIDYIFLNHEIISKITNFEILYEGDNLSDHFPLFLKLNKLNENGITNDVFSDQSNEQVHIYWSKASTQDKLKYKSLLEGMLKDIVLPGEAIECNNFECKMHKNLFDEFLFGIVESIQAATLGAIPNNIWAHKRGKGKVSKPIPGWNYFVKEFQQKSIFWNKIWSENDSPNNGILFDLRKKSRRDYHNAIKMVKMNEDYILRSNVGSALSDSNPKIFWQQIRKIKNCRTEISKFIDGESNQDACNVFMNKYVDLYSKSDNHQVFESLKIRCRSNIESICSNRDNEKNIHLHRITPEMVKNAVSSLHKGKVDDDLIIFTDAFIEAPYILFILLSCVFTIMLTHGFNSSIFDLITIHPIIKIKENQNLIQVIIVRFQSTALLAKF